jgi:hypothetical protein
MDNIKIEQGQDHKQNTVIIAEEFPTDNAITFHTHLNNGVIVGDYVPAGGRTSIENIVIKQESFQYEFCGDYADVPDIVAAETVITTTPPRSRHAYSLDDVVKGSPLCVKIFSPDHKTETVFLDHSLEDGSVWSQLAAGKFTRFVVWVCLDRKGVNI